MVAVIRPGPDIVLVYKKSQLQLALENKNARIKGLVDEDDVSVRALRLAHEAHDGALRAVSETLKKARCNVQRIYRARLKPEHSRGRLLVSVGGDGTLLDASHKVCLGDDDDVGAAVGVNSDTARSTGFLCAADAASFPALLDDILARLLTPTPVRRLAGAIDGKPLPFPVLNDLLISHKNPAATSKYLVGHRGIVEDHKSSGVWVCTAAGSTAAMTSAGGAIQELSDQRLHFRVRELFREPPSDRAVSRAAWQHDDFFFDGNDDVVVTSKMREGRVWLDGPHCSVDLPMGARLVLHGRCPPLRLYATAAMGERRRVARAEAEARAARARAGDSGDPVD
jgi:NAD+ kinase